MLTCTGPLTGLPAPSTSEPGSKLTLAPSRPASAPPAAALASTSGASRGCITTSSQPSSAPAGRLALRHWSA
jgi:hypothetical protein